MPVANTTSIRVSNDAKERLDEIAAQHRLTLTRTFDVLLDCWDATEERDQTAIIQEGGEK